VDVAALRTFFMWCTITNFALLMFMFLMWTLTGDWIHRMHGKWFAIPPETFNSLFYLFLGIYKLLIIVFNAVPFIVLWMMG
jgi:hypothetical protein